MVDEDPFGGERDGGIGDRGEESSEPHPPADPAARVRAALTALLSGHVGLRKPDSSAQVMGAGTDDLEAGQRFLRLLGAWAVPSWPEDIGGLGLDQEAAAVVAEELARFETPDLYPWMIGLSLIGPTLLAHGSPQQRARWLAPIRTGEEIWCQLFSEPGAGSDLAGLACRAETLDSGEAWRVTGQKVWSSRAQYSRWGLLLARTDPSVPKHAGITAFAVDMERPGVDVRPIVQINGDTHFNEVFLDDVRVPDADRIGAVGDGWRVAITALTHERASIGQTGAALSADQVIDLVRRSGRRHDRLVRQRAAEVVSRLEIARFSALRRRADARAGKPIGPEGAGAKIWMSDTVKLAADLALSLGGLGSVTGHTDWQTLFLTGPSMSIRGGTDEVMRNILAERVLGLPRDPGTDKSLPFNQAPRA